VPTSAGAARRFIDLTLTGWGCDALVDSVVLLVSEVVTNAILHARSDIEVRVGDRGAMMRVEVIDHSDGEPVLRSYAEDSSSGRGLAIVEQVASAWGVTKIAGGKLVWFEVAA
jgi:anti-sigma regulatory factor (Ser/Thr protein kinase)